MSPSISQHVWDKMVTDLIDRDERLKEAIEILKQYLSDNGRGVCGECYGEGLWDSFLQKVVYWHAPDCRLGKFMKMIKTGGEEQNAKS